MPNIKSSKAQRNSLRIQSGAEIAGNAAGMLSPVAKIPCKVAQSVASLYSFFSRETSKVEKAIGLTQAAISMAQVALLGYVYAQQVTCPKDDSFCTALMLCDLVYEGILLSNVFVSEMNKQRTDVSAPSTPLLPQEDKKDEERANKFVMWDR